MASDFGVADLAGRRYGLARALAGRMNLWKLKWWVLLTAQSVLLGGCATSALWEEGRFARYREPASQPNLQLYHSAQRQDVLVGARRDARNPVGSAHSYSTKDSR